MSSSNPPPAAGVRVHWEELPLGVRRAIEKRVGGPVVESITQSGGFSPGLAARVRTIDGRRCFVKAVSEQANPDTHHIHRREAEVVAALPAAAPVPRLLWSFDRDGWVALGFEDIDGHSPAQPWRGDELSLVVDGLLRLHDVLTPSPLVSTSAGQAFATHIKGWSELEESQAVGLDPWCYRNLERLVDLEAIAPSSAAGETLLNFDVRADNIVIANDRVYFVDWPWARIGAPFVDWVAFAPSVYMQGGPNPERLLRMAELREVEATAIDAVLAALTGYLIAYSRRPPPLGIPTVRAFQAAQGDVALAWLRERTGWE